MSVATDAPVLEAVFASGSVLDAAGNPHPVHSHVPRDFAEALLREVKKRKPRVVLEVGMAYGVSSLAIAYGLQPGARFISIDPFQNSQWEGIGKANVARTGAAHELVEELSHFALPRLLAEGLEVDFAYIDGNHTFEAVLLDFFYIDKMLKVGGVVAFNDAGWPAIHRVLRFVTRHRKYREIDVGLPKTYGKSLRNHIPNRLAGRFSADRYFEKVEDFEPRYDFWAPF
ncbi:MAG TPA: class I SAM-dependent methyltransferase [Caulobacteraceae bacterium]|nr:class I SAM-dependent methyltransferase [Caulobacteraceae bacterium]